jgi:alpha-ketoglutarate-dependent taurine dioxygenase
VAKRMTKVTLPDRHHASWGEPGDNGPLFLVLDQVPENELLLRCAHFGDVVPYRGRKTYQVRPSPAHTGLYSALSKGDLYPHLDKYEWPQPPDTVVLYCKHRDHGARGATLVCDMRPFLRSLSTAERHLLTTLRVTFVADEGLRSQGDSSVLQAPILDERDPTRPRLRYSYNYTKLPHPNAMAADLRERILAYFSRNKIRILLQPGQLLLIRNTLLLHAREAFDDPGRLLLRVYLRDSQRGWTA